jgi:hypothetical protein
MALGDVIKPQSGGQLRAEVLDWYSSDSRDRLHAGPVGHQILVENMLGFRSDYRRYY